MAGRKRGKGKRKKNEGGWRAGREGERKRREGYTFDLEVLCHKTCYVYFPAGDNMLSH